MTLINASILVLILIIVFWWSNRKPTSAKGVGFKFPESDYRFCVYQRPRKTNEIHLILEGDKIDELGYRIYKSHTVDLDKIDILIRDNGTGEVMKIVKDGDSESMIGVSHPDMGHIGYLKFDIVQIN